MAVCSASHVVADVTAITLVPHCVAYVLNAAPMEVACVAHARLYTAA